ncbi:MAG: zf-HC2 domain-containing protein [Gemmatimonadota bacterium]|nr:zf-HC2 domain-containing protein [Gemmatimonadota bacterium]MDH5804118.1 zf-HC2 domain-containing protein [Gemmatimonadota bacterium]
MIFKRSMIDCHEAVSRIHELLDGELEAGWEKKIRAHLDACGHCTHLFEFEEAFLCFLKKQDESVGVPEELRRKLLDKLKAESA